MKQCQLSLASLSSSAPAFSKLIFVCEHFNFKGTVRWLQYLLLGISVVLSLLSNNVPLWEEYKVLSTSLLSLTLFTFTWGGSGAYSLQFTHTYPQCMFSVLKETRTSLFIYMGWMWCIQPSVHSYTSSTHVQCVKRNTSFFVNVNDFYFIMWDQSCHLCLYHHKQNNFIISLTSVSEIALA